LCTSSTRRRPPSRTASQIAAVAHVRNTEIGSRLTARIERNLGWIVLTIVLVGCLLVLWPFVSALLWAVVLCFSTWPLYQRVLKWLHGRKTLAATTMTLAMLLVVLAPFMIIGTTLADSVKELAAVARHSLETGPPEPPPWMGKIPLIGPSASAYWASLAADTGKLAQEIRRFIEPASAWLLRIAIALAGGLLELTLSIFVAFFLFRDGVSAAQRLVTAVERIGGERGRHLLTVAGNTVRGVVYGILGTALVQAVMAGIGFVIAGVPGVSLLALLTFF
jgi:predicted PurR-regulated permease PerM